MTGYLFRRLAGSLVLLLLVLTTTFVILQLAPGDPTDRFDDPRIPREASERLREAWGLDRPLLEQYLSWLQAVGLRWDWGISFLYREPVTRAIARFLPATLLLALGAMLFQYSIGLVTGILAAARPGGLLDHWIRLGSILLYSLPFFWFGLMAVLIFSNWLHLFPPSGMQSVFAAELPLWPRILDLMQHLILPAFVLGLPLSAEVTRYIRNSLLEALGQDYIRAARARGLSEFRVIWIHGLRNSAAPLIQLAGISIPFLLSGAFAVEFVFAWPGLGRATLDAIAAKDYPMVLGTTAFAGALVVFGNLVADLLLAVADPRVRHSRAATP